MHAARSEAHASTRGGARAPGSKVGKMRARLLRRQQSRATRAGRAPSARARRLDVIQQAVLVIHPARPPRELRLRSAHVHRKPGRASADAAATARAPRRACPGTPSGCTPPAPARRCSGRFPRRTGHTCQTGAAGPPRRIPPPHRRRRPPSRRRATARGRGRRRASAHVSGGAPRHKHRERSRIRSSRQPLARTPDADTEHCALVLHACDASDAAAEVCEVGRRIAAAAAHTRFSCSPTRATAACSGSAGSTAARHAKLSAEQRRGSACGMSKQRPPPGARRIGTAARGNGRDDQASRT